MINNSFVGKLCRFFVLLFLTSITLHAQNPNFSGELSNLVTDDSRFGWIKIKVENKLNADGFFSTLSESNSLTQTFSFVRQNSIQDKFGTTHQLYQVHYQNIPIDDQYWVLHEKSGNVFLAQGQEPPAIQAVSNQPSIASSNALEIILSQPDSFNVKKYAWEDATLESNLKLVTGDRNATHFPKGQLVWAKDAAAQTYKLAYRFDIFRTKPISKKRYYVDANTRQIFREYDLLVTNCFESSDATSSANHKHLAEDKIAKITADIPATGKANYVTLNNGIVNFTSDNNGVDYTLKASNLGPDNNQVILTQTANNQYDFDNLTDIRDTDNDWQDDPTAIGAHWGTEQVYDYFLNTHGRKSFDGAGAPMISYVNFGTNYVNAFWNGVNMTYGDGDGTNWGALTSIDVIAHEIAHGVTENNGLGGLIYYGESGALNESFSDIFGAVVEFEKHPDGGDWLMGEDFDFANNDGFRNLQNPSAEGDPANYFGNNWYTGAGDNGGVHINSGVQNYWFFLLTTGGTGTSEFGYDYDISGIGLDKSAAICYRNLTTYMHPNATYLDARNGAIQAAIDLYGENSAEHQSTEEAWCAVGIGTTCLPSFTVYTPTLNELLFNGTSREITWSSTMPELISSVRIEYTTETGSNPNWNLIVSGEPNDGSYIWDIPNIHSTTMRVRVGMSSSGNSPGNPLIAGISPTFNVIPCAAVETFEGPENLELNGTAIFAGLAPGDSYEWLINDVSISTNKDLSHTFVDYGAYKLTYKITNNTYNCINTETKYFYLIPDDVCEARVIDLNTLYEGELNGATVEPNEPSPPAGDCSAAGYWCHNTINGSVWYSFVAPPSGLVNIITSGNSYLDNRIALYEGIDCGLANPFENVNLLGANDDIPNQCCNGSRIDKICLSPGETYHIQVDPYSSVVNQNGFTIIVEEGQVENPLVDEGINCSMPEGWSFEKGFGHNAGIYSYTNLNTCFDCALGNRGFGLSATTYIQLPQFDFSLENVEILFFEYAHVPQNDTVNNELRVEIADACGSFTNLLTIPNNEISTNAAGTNSSNEEYVPDCTEVRKVQIDLSSHNSLEKANLRIALDGHFLNPILLDNFFIGAPNDTCRMLDSLVLVDLYNATDGPNWTTSWDLTQPMNTWTGVTLNGFGCVTGLDLDGEPDCFGCTNGGIGMTGALPTNFVNLIQLKSLSLGRNSLSGVIPSSIDQLSKLENLSMRSNNFSGAIPSELGNLVNLESLNLSNNQFAGAIPSTFNNLVKLRELFLQSNNNLNSLPDLSNLHQLYYLHIGNNDISGTIPDWMGSLPNLFYIYAYGNNFEGTLPNTFATSNSFYRINFENNNLSGILPDLSNNPYLIGLYLSGNNFEGSIPSWLLDCQNLYDIYLGSNQFSGQVPNFSSLEQLTSLNLDFNQLTFEDIIPHISAINTRIAGNSEYSWQDYYYAPQEKIGVSTNFLLVEGEDYTFDLGIDDAISDNIYKWSKDGALFQEITGNNKLTITNATTADLGVYTCEVTNVGASELTLSSHKYSLVDFIPANDNVCDAIAIDFEQTYTGTFNGASSEENEPSASSGDCETSWCSTSLNGSVWYSFTPTRDTFVRIEVAGVDFSDTKIALYEGVDCTNLEPFSNHTLIAANDNKPNFCCDGSLIKLACLTANETYYLQVEQGGDELQNDFNLTIVGLPSCGLVCDLVVNFSNINQESCPDSGDGYIDVHVRSDAGHVIRYELYDANKALISTSNYSFFGNLIAGTYTIIAVSKDDENCFLDTEVTIDPKIDETPPTVICLTDTINVAFVHSAQGLPWGWDFYLGEMNNVFGDDWHQLQFESLNANLLFSNYYNVVYLEGSGVSTSVLGAFLNTNKQLIEDWVALGNTLFINVSADGGQNIDLGFDGVTLNYPVYTDSAFVIAPSYTIFNTPNTPITDKYRGGNFSHSSFSKGNLTATTLMESKEQGILLMEADWTDGKVIFGAINPIYWIDQSTEIGNIRLNILEYLKANTIMATSPPIQVALDESLSASLSLNELKVDAFDACAFKAVTLDETDFNCNDIGVKDILLTAIDAANNTDICSAQIEIIDPNEYCTGNECEEEQILDDLNITTGIYMGKTIKSEGTIAGGQEVTFMAENAISLLPGFNAGANVDFTAMIQANLCADNFVEESSEDRNTIDPQSTIQLNDFMVRPNPFNTATTVDFELNKEQEVFLAVYSMAGQELVILKNGKLSKGRHQLEFQAAEYNPGMYLVLLRTATSSLTKKIILLSTQE